MLSRHFTVTVDRKIEMAWLTDKLLFTKPSRRLIDPAEVIMHGLHNECPFELASFLKPICWRAERLVAQMEVEDFDMNIVWDRLGIRREMECLTNYLSPYYPYWVKFLLATILLYSCTAPLWLLLWHLLNGQQTDIWAPDKVTTESDPAGDQNNFDVAPVRTKLVGISSISRPSTSEGTDTTRDKLTVNEPILQARSLPRESSPSLSTSSRCSQRQPSIRDRSFK
ncbi:uncharacterized protein LOC129591283 isoform X2 [Paramacrobiotus metropolitanus]|uniref:uncharacterized protein LOC129591283 isoform X2 n=1 Tax=Paramacrobiotus metropolitanus TaxID=2943436 RepID=UPI002445795E|nr:uncharacterized protein LOC129591283 isoform X2 [Paramacrobiotus metropolitanus]